MVATLPPTLVSRIIEPLHSGIASALTFFVERLPANGTPELLSIFISGVRKFLDEPPYIEHGFCHISENNAWMTEPAIRAVQKLVGSQSSHVFDEDAMWILLVGPRLGEHAHYHYLMPSKRDELESLVPGWPELNDRLYWATIEEENARRLECSEKALRYDGQLQWMGHYWNYDQDSVPRLVSEIRSGHRDNDEKLVAVSTAFRVINQSENPAPLIDSLKEATQDSSQLKAHLDSFLNPEIPDWELEAREQREADEREQEKAQRDRLGRRAKWLAKLKSDPLRLKAFPELMEEETLKDLIGLYHEIDGDGIKTTRLGGAHWRDLESVVGAEVARAYRDAIVQLWRDYKAPLQSESGPRGSFIPWVLILAMSGLEIEATETEDFPQTLSEKEAERALRYITWEINRFPSWFERIYRVFPRLAEEAVLKELFWELETTKMGDSSRLMLRMLCSYGGWLHGAVAPKLLEWIASHPGSLRTDLDLIFQVLIGGGVDPSELASIAEKELAVLDCPEVEAEWLALFVDCDPQNGIPKLQIWLSSLDRDEASKAAQLFLTSLIGDRRGSRGRVKVGCFEEPPYLKSLYGLMCEYIRQDEDIDRSEGGPFTPELRDDAQSAREQLLHQLAKIEGKAAYIALMQLADEQSDALSGNRIRFLAMRRAEEDGELPPWTAGQVSEFHKKQEVVPRTHAQLYELAVERLLDLKDWIERGNHSPWVTWQRAEKENEMRTLVASWLGDRGHGKYTIAEEPELANDQRMDIWLDNPTVQSPVPIELKLLDKGWSGPDLCERLRNQLAGDYLREPGANCGVFLLVGQRLGQSKRWRVNDNHVGIGELAQALKRYWGEIDADYPGVDDIKVIVIDISLRGQVSDS